MKYIVDVDGTICSLNITADGKNEYEFAKPFMKRIEHLNKLYDEGHEIHYWTARGMSNGNLEAKQQLTIKQFEEWGVKYTSLNFKKPHYDIWIDDKAQNEKDFFGNIDG